MTKDKLKNITLIKDDRPIWDFPRLSTGSTLLDLELTGDAFGGYVTGRYYLLVGDSSSGKTFLTMACLAEAAQNPDFDDYRFIYDDVEKGNLFNLKKLFGKSAAERIEAPCVDEDDYPECSYTVEDFYFNLQEAVDVGEPFIYILDSQDGLSSGSEIDKFEDHRQAAKSGKKAPGSYGDGKAKIHSSTLRKFMNPLQEMQSLLIIVNQTRDSLGFGFNPKTRSGGKALGFYAGAEIWTSVKKRITKTIGGKTRSIGKRIIADIKKNRLSGNETKVEFDLFPSYGIDDLSSCIEFLIQEKVWKKGSGGKIKPEKLFDSNESFTEKNLIKAIEEEGVEKDLKKLVGNTWAKIEQRKSLQRKPRYQ